MSKHLIMQKKVVARCLYYMASEQSKKLIMSTLLLLIFGAGTVYVFYRMVTRFVDLMFNSKKGMR